jgi:HlyD family secretion protein
MSKRSRGWSAWAGPATLLVVFACCSGQRQAPGGSGFIEATEATVSAEVAGQVRSVRFDEGSPVAVGDTLAEIDTVTTALRLGQARSGMEAAQKKVSMAAIAVEQAGYNADLATKDYDRARALVESGSIDQQRFDAMETAYKQAALARKQAAAALESAQADLSRAGSDVKLLEKQLGDCFPKSPLKGVVTAKFVTAGEWAGVGKPLMRVASLDTVWVKVYLPAADLTRIALGGRAAVDPEDGRSAPLAGRVTWISSEAEFTPKNVQTKEARADLVYAVKVTVANPGAVLKIGMPVSVKIQ